MRFFDVLGLLGGTATVAAVGIWLLKKAIDAAASRSVQKSVETHKADLARDLETHKVALSAASQERIESLRASLGLFNQREVEKLRAELGRDSDGVKHELQIALMKAQTANSKIHEVYPNLFELLTKAQGTIGGLIGVRFASDYSYCNVDDFKRIMDKAEIAAGRQEELLAELEDDRKRGISELDKTLRNVEVSNAQRAHTEARNYVLLKALYIPKPLIEQAHAVLQELWGAWVEASMDEAGRRGRDPDIYFQHIKKAQEGLGEIEAAMRKELAEAG